jgi:hypothetical protein
MLGGMQHDRTAGGRRRQERLGHPIDASAREAAHLHAVFNAGESAATPVIAPGVVLAVVGPLAAILILLDFGVAHFW